MNANRPYDAQIAQQAIQSAQRSANAPTFAQQHTGTGASDYQAQGVQTFVNDEARAQKAQFESVYGNPTVQKQRQAEITAGRALNPSAAPEQQRYADTVLKAGGKLPKSVEEARYGPTAEQALAGQKFEADQSNDAAALELKKRSVGAQETNAQANVIRATKPTTAPLNMAEIRKQQDRQRTAFDSDPELVVSALQPDIRTGGPTQAMIDVMGGLNDPNVPPAKRLQRAAELAAAGAPATAVEAIRRRALEQQDREAVTQKQQADQAKTVSTAATGILAQIRAGTMTPEEVPIRAQQLGIPLDALEEQIRQQWEAAGRPLVPNTAPGAPR